jgi:hypothetical protein
MATFTHTIPFPQTCHESTKAFYDYWLAKCRGRRMPSRSDVDPIEIQRALLPGISLIEIVSDDRRYVYRLVGTAVVDAAGQDYTGRSVRNALSGFALGRALRNYDRVVSTRAPVFDPTHLQEVNSSYAIDETLLLPLSNDGETVNKILGFNRLRLVQNHAPAFFTGWNPLFN